jgi:hypothetical protein
LGCGDAFSERPIGFTDYLAERLYPT